MTSKGKSNVVLTERDLALLVSLYRYRYLSLTQVERLHFDSAQTAVRRIRRLRTGGVIDDFRVPGVEERLVRLTKQGLTLVAEHLGLSLEDLGDRTRPKDYYFVRHFLATSDFRITLAEACAVRRDVSLLGFLPDYLGVRTGNGVQKYLRDVVADVTRPGAQVVHTPDAVFALERAGRVGLFFLEIDRGTEGISDPERGFAKILRYYLNALAAGSFDRYRTDFGAEAFASVRVLVVTSGDERLKHIRALGGRMHFEPSRAKQFIWFVTADTVTPSMVLGPIWHSLDPLDAGCHPIVSDQKREDAVR